MMRTSDTWRPASGHASVADLEWEVARLREELSRVRAELAQERARGGGRRITAEFRPPAAALDARTEPSGGAPAWPPADRGRDPADPPAPRAPRGHGDAPIAPFPARPVGPTFVLPRDQGLDFGAIKQLSAEELDALPYGLITLDAEGRILHYNDTESRMVGLPKHAVLGRKFFGEVAPCARVREFEGRFLELVRDPYRVRVQTFDFVFRFPNGDQQVTIVLTPAKERGQYHMALLRRDGDP